MAIRGPTDSNPPIQMVAFYSPDWHVMLRGSRKGIEQLQMALASPGECDLRFWLPERSSLGKYSEFVHSAKVRIAPDESRVRIQVRRQSLEIEGAPRYLSIFAAQIGEVAEQAESPAGPRQGFHAHFEPFPQPEGLEIPHPILDASSFPLIVAYYTPQEATVVFTTQGK